VEVAGTVTDPRTTPDDARHDLVRWFGRGVAGLVLPTGWFGRPFDNAHELTWCEARKDRLLVELDGLLLLTATRQLGLETTEDELVVTAEQVVFDWIEYGTPKAHAEIFAPGSFRFVRPD
jgi:hypothetical protein